MRRLVLVAVLALGAGREPATITVGQAGAADSVYGPADMLCDLYTCRLFNLPQAAGMAANTIVEFGIPKMGGQDRVQMRRCLQQLCRASVLGHPSGHTSPPGHGYPALLITPAQLRLE